MGNLAAQSHFSMRRLLPFVAVLRIQRITVSPKVTLAQAIHFF